MRHELSFERSASLNEKRPIDCLVGYVQLCIVRKFRLKPPRDLLRRPVRLQLARHQSAKLWLLSESAFLRPPTTIPCRIVCESRAVACRVTVSTNLPANRRRRA